MIELHLKIEQQSNGFYDLIIGAEGACGQPIICDFGPYTFADGTTVVSLESMRSDNADDLMALLEDLGAATAEDFLGDVPHKVINQINPIQLQHMFIAKEPA